MLALALSGVAMATSAQTLTWREVLQAAQVTHPLVRAKQAGLAGARADLDAAQWRRFPTPTVETGSLGGSSTRTLRLDQPLWAGGRIDAGIAGASRREESADAAIEETRRELVLKALASISDAIRQAERLEVAQRNLADHDRLLALIQRRVAQEVSPEADEALARSRRALAANDVSQARQGLRNALTQLAQLSGQSVSRLDSTGYAEAAQVGAVIENLAPLHEQAVTASPTLRRLQAEAEATEADTDAKRAERWPLLVLRVEQLRGTVNDTRSGVVLSYQPGAGLAVQAGVAAATARGDAAREAIASARRDLEQQLTQEWTDGQAARERLQTAQLVRSSATDVANSYARQYAVGRKSWLDVLNAVREAGQAELSWVDTRHQAWLSALRLRVLTGPSGVLDSAGVVFHETAPAADAAAALTP